MTANRLSNVISLLADANCGNISFVLQKSTKGNTFLWQKIIPKYCHAFIDVVDFHASLYKDGMTISGNYVNDDSFREKFHAFLQENFV